MHACVRDSRYEARTGWTGVTQTDFAGLEPFGKVGLEPKTKGQNTAFNDQKDVKGGKVFNDEWW